MTRSKQVEGDTMADEEYYKATTFEEKWKALTKGVWTAEQRRQSAEQVAYLCQCSKCPSYANTGEDAGVFCTLGKSGRIQEQKGCLCDQCPLTKMMNLRWQYYCTEGNAYDRSELKNE